ncbi:hypothetical protein B0J11DRAFT_509827 [Dendryphion nanum]|uniref:Uncharacterized protein n=1 Tax=Dendryphion nanum TaxID=256645 RepID=A0A9P9DCN8_9PLEO|nr:hypothetical protein B0J11DRAFT_509827 [Dendryphion nanum]
MFPPRPPSTEDLNHPTFIDPPNTFIYEDTTSDFASPPTALNPFGAERSDGFIPPPPSAFGSGESKTVLGPIAVNPFAEIIQYNPKETRQLKPTRPHWTKERILEIAANLNDTPYESSVFIQYPSLEDVRKGSSAVIKETNMTAAEVDPKNWGNKIDQNKSKAARLESEYELEKLTSIMDTVKDHRIKTILGLNLGANDTVTSIVNHQLFAHIVNKVRQMYMETSKIAWVEELVVVYQVENQIISKEHEPKNVNILKGMKGPDLNCLYQHRVKEVHDPLGLKEINESTLIVCLNKEKPFRQILGDYLLDQRIAPFGLITYPPQFPNWRGNDPESRNLEYLFPAIGGQSATCPRLPNDSFFHHVWISRMHQEKDSLTNEDVDVLYDTSIFLKEIKPKVRDIMLVED